MIKERHPKFYHGYYVNKMTLLKYKFCESLSPNLFHGIYISTCPLEKLNDLIKSQLPYSTVLPTIVDAVELVSKRLEEEGISVEVTELTQVHHD